MGRPSIFSKDYEKIMRRRRRRFTIITIVLVCIVGAVAFKAVNYDYSGLKDRLQKWVNEPSDIEKDDEEKQIAESIGEQDPTENPADNNLLEEPQVEEEKDVYIDVDINGTKISFKIEETAKTESTTGENSNEAQNTVEATGNTEASTEENKNQVAGSGEANNSTEKKITAVKEVPADFTVEISSTGKNALILDNNQNIYVVDLEAVVKNVTLAQYTAPDGEVFEKETVRNTYQGYLWSVSPKFISEDKIAYISNIPYFGSDLKKYISIVDINTNSHTILWGSKATEITFGDKQDKGLEAKIDGNSYFINENGDLVY